MTIQKKRTSLHYIFHSVPKIMAFQLIELETVQQNAQDHVTHAVQLNNINCPICQQAVIDWSEEQYVQPCEHTLFIAMDLGFEYISDVFEGTMRYTVDEIHANDENSNVFEEITHSTYADFMILKADLGVEGLCRYVGFTQ